MSGWDIVNSNGIWNLKTHFNMWVKSIIGCGMPPQEVISTEYGLIDGSKFERIILKERILRLVGTLKGDGSYTSLLVNRLALARQLDREISTAISSTGEETVTPIYLRYTLGGKSLQIPCVYQSGLEGGPNEGDIEQDIPLEFKAVNPLWEELTDDSESLPGVTASSVNYILRTTGANQWDNLDNGTSGPVYAIHENADYIYAGGTFAEAGATPVTVNNIARYNKTTEEWEAIGGGTVGVAGGDATVYAIAEDSNGIIYVGGHFITAGGTTVNKICSYDPGTDTFSAMGTGLSDVASTFRQVNALITDGDDNLYIGGNIGELNGVANFNNFAIWNGVTYINPNGGVNSDVFDFALDGDTLYVAGDFGNGGTPSVSSYAIILYSISGDSFTALVGAGGARGINTMVRSMALTGSGVIYFGGENEIINGPLVSTDFAMTGAAKWDGTDFTDLVIDDTADKVIYAIAWDSVNELLYIGGDYTEINGDATKTIVSIYDGSTWDDLEIDLESFATQVRAINIYGSSIVFGFTGTGTLNLPEAVTVTNNGTARAYPVITITGPGHVSQINNTTIGTSILFRNLTLATGETMIIDTTPGNQRIYSNTRSNLLSYLVSGSNFSTFFLVPGTNVLAVQIDDTTVTRTISWTPTHYTLDAITGI